MAICRIWVSSDAESKWTKRHESRKFTQMNQSWIFWLLNRRAGAVSRQIITVLQTLSNSIQFNSILFNQRFSMQSNHLDWNLAMPICNWDWFNWINAKFQHWRYLTTSFCTSKSCWNYEKNSMHSLITYLQLEYFLKILTW